MANDFYSVTGSPGTGTFGASDFIRQEFVAIQSGFDKFPGLTGNSLQLLRINVGETALDTIPVSGLGSVVLGTGATLNSPILITPQLGTPASGNLVNCTGLLISGIAGLGTGVGTALAVNVGSAGAFVVNGGALGTPSSGVATNLTGTAASLTAGAVAVGGITGLGTGVATALAVNVGSAGAPVVNGGALGTPSSGVATNLTGTAAGLTAGTASAVAVGGITGLGTGVATALAVNTGTSGAVFVNSVSATNVLLGRKTAGAGVVEEITQAGDVTLAGSTFTLANTAVTPAAYTNTNLTVDSKGRITAASNGTAGVPWAVAAGSANAITATYAPVNASLTDGLLLAFRASAANTTTTPTFSPDGLTARTITKRGGAALSAGDIPGALAEVVVRYNLANTRWELQNPGWPVFSQLTASLGTDVPLSSLSTVFGGPTIAQGTVGTWIAWGWITVRDAAGASLFQARIWDGTTIKGATRITPNGANVDGFAFLCGIFNAPTGNIQIAAQNLNTTTGLMKANVTGFTVDSTINAIRIA